MKITNNVRTIQEAIAISIQQLGGKGKSDEIYNKILELRLYNFHAANPLAVLKNTLHRHCVSILQASTFGSQKIFNKNIQGYWYMAEAKSSLINNLTFPITRFWFSQSLHILSKDADLFSSSKMREARITLIAGNKMLVGIKDWLNAAQLLMPNTGRQTQLSDTAKYITQVDGHLNKSSSWLSIHLNIFFSNKNDPYFSMFRQLAENKIWYTKKDLVNSLDTNKAADSIDSSLTGIFRTITKDGPLADLKLVDYRNKNIDGSVTEIHIGTPKIPDEAIIYGLILARKRHAPSAVTITFDSLLGYGLHHALCLSAKDLRERLRAIYRDPRWTGWFRFEEGNNMNSVYIDTQLTERNALLRLLQEAPDTWF